MIKNRFKEIDWEKESKEILIVLGLALFVVAAYLYLNYQQRQIDNNLGITKGKILEHKIFVAQSGWEVKYVYVVAGKVYKDRSSTEKKLSLDYNKTYVVEYSRENPKYSRIIIDGVTYADGVD